MKHENVYTILVILDLIPVEQHGNKLNNNNSKEEEHKDNTNRLKMKIFFSD